MTSGQRALKRTRRSLHGLAELVLAGPQYRTSGTIRLRVAPGGFATVAPPALGVAGVDLVAADARHPVDGRSYADLAVSVAEVNYGVSLGDSYLAEPYAYVGPWRPREGSFWNAPFGAARPVRGLSSVDALLGFLTDDASVASRG
ncbi:MAG TPA: hypothetical protein VFM54_02265 [Micromonosporaceae bacterium]|nr:hypothetical protein [Micromonosporaceae bacterium]